MAALTESDKPKRGLDWEYVKAQVLAYVDDLESKDKSKRGLGLRLNLTRESRKPVNTDKDGNFLIRNNDRKHNGD